MPRRFIRHPAEIPIQLCSHSAGHENNLISTTTDVSAGGLSCETDVLLQPGDAVEVEIAIESPSFKTIGHVVWCRPAGNRYLIGIGFSDLATAYAVRMVEQVCHIEQYRLKILEQEKRQLSSEEAALEWIRLHAEDFPQSIHH